MPSCSKGEGKNLEQQQIFYKKRYGQKAARIYLSKKNFQAHSVFGLATADDH
jgi:hypothetical protein